MSTKFLPSQTGAVFMADVETESDGALTILSNYGDGYRSAHRNHAAQHFGTHALWAMNRLTWVNAHGVRVILTRWHTTRHYQSHTALSEGTDR